MDTVKKQMLHRVEEAVLCLFESDPPLTPMRLKTEGHLGQVILAHPVEYLIPPSCIRNSANAKHSLAISGL